MLIRLAVIPLALVMAIAVLAGCGGNGALSGAEKRQAADEFAMARSSVEIHMTDQSDLSPELEAIARRTLLEQDTEAFIALVRKWSERGMSDRDAQRHLNDAVSSLGGECPSCVAQLDRERETYG